MVDQGSSTLDSNEGLKTTAIIIIENYTNRE